jgi:hypothetical protein
MIPLALLVLLAPAAARAGELEFDKPSAGLVFNLDDSSGITPPSDEETRSPCACAASKRCWKVVMTMDAKLFSLREEEVEKALPNRFFPAALTFTLRRPTRQGHFLVVKCGPEKRTCADKRDILEERVIKSSLLASLPLNLPEGTLFDPTTLKLTEAGEKTFVQVKSCRKPLLAELAAVVTASGAQ